MANTVAPALVAPIVANRWLIAITVALGALMEIIDSSIVNVALVNIQASLGATLTQVSWVVSGYAIANVVILPLSAWIGDKNGQNALLYGFARRLYDRVGALRHVH